jgi:hypothetical protein
MASLKSNVDMRKYLFLFLLLCSLNLFAQEKVQVQEQDYRNNEVEMADAMRAEGKIYVVVAVLVVMFSGLLAYAIRIDQKVGRLEKELVENEVDAGTVA